ncbi:MAG: hypothetical protein K6F50_02460 [Kiritimatiellae bacterium]|nr:hypothetical protein [Kiritimatiellia bacterium]
MNEKNNTAAVAENAATKDEQAWFRPKFALYKPNGKGTGCALKLELHPAHGSVEGSIWAMFASQLTIGDRRAPNPTYPRFDWDNVICVKLGFQDLTRILQVFRGECEAIEDGKGLFHRSPRGTTKIGLRHHVEPNPGYSFEVHRSVGLQAEDSHAHIFIAPNEALGLCSAIENALGVICFGIPVVVERDTSVYRRSVREMDHAKAS